jgi:glutaredoxin-like YruB-family protein
MKNVSIYSTPTCTYCNMAKEFFKKNNVAYTEFNVASDSTKRAEMIEKSGQMGVPVIDIDGQVVVGYDKDTVAGLLGIK